MRAYCAQIIHRLKMREAIAEDRSVPTTWEAAIQIDMSNSKKSNVL